VVLGAFLVLRFTTFGKHVYATGGSESVARLSGIHTARVKLAVYVISSCLACLAGLTLTSRLGSGDPLVGQPYSLDSITSAVIGGASLFGGRGSVLGSFAGALILTILSNILNLKNVSPYYQWILKGLIIIVALAFTFERRARRRRQP
jgi:ribose transport system permease protein